MTKLITLDYQGIALTANREAWFNATEIAEAYNKRLAKFWEREETQEYLNELCELSNIPKTGYLGKPFNLKNYPEFIKAKRGNNGGTWLHPDLMVYFARWINIRFGIWADQQIKNLLLDGKSWNALRADSKLGYQIMSEILQAKRAAEGKETENHHYINEALLCNAAITGQFKSLDRESLSKPTLNMLIRLEGRNAALIGQGLSYEQRKTALFDMAARVRSSFQMALSAEGVA